jgi:hypothetical protein
MIKPSLHVFILGKKSSKKKEETQQAYFNQTWYKLSLCKGNSNLAMFSPKGV